MVQQQLPEVFLAELSLAKPAFGKILLPQKILCTKQKKVVSLRKGSLCHLFE
jgi:hypothetical protein